MTNEIRKYLQQKRKALGLNQSEMGNKIHTLYKKNWKKDTLSKFESGKYIPALFHAYILSKTYGFNLDEYAHLVYKISKDGKNT